MFIDRADAGRALARLLHGYGKRQDVTVLALPRGGVPVAYEVARALDAPLDVLIVRKLGLPGQPELAMGAIGPGGILHLNEDVIRLGGVTPSEIERVVARETAELKRRGQRYRGGRPPMELRGRTAIVVDDGIATGASMAVAITALRQLHPAEIVVAVPVAPDRTAEQMDGVADRFVCVETPLDFGGVGQFYQRFDQTTDDEVADLLARSAQRPA